jgi:uncharacterized protein (DUF58 family)
MLAPSIGALLVALGALSGAHALVAVGILVLLTAFLRTLWTRFGLRGVAYERRLRTDRAVVGDEIPLDVVVWNRKPLPLPWLRGEDFATDGVTLRERPLVATDRPGVVALENVWTLAWYERVSRHFHVVADRRGSFGFDGVRLRVADLFARDSAEEERALPVTYLVRPRTVPVLDRAPATAPEGDRLARRSLFRDPTLFAGVRPYQPGDPLRQVHWKATARTGRTVVKRFDPSRRREIVIALDVQTVEGPHWLMAYDEDLVEGLCVAAASIARQSLAEGASCGLVAAAYTRTPRPIAWVPPSAGPGQLGAIADTLGRLASFASTPFDRVLASLPRRIGPGATIVVLTARDPRSLLPTLRRLARSGYAVEVVVMGHEARPRAAAARAVGIPARVASLDPDWRTSEALVVTA